MQCSAVQAVSSQSQVELFSAGICASELKAEAPTSPSPSATSHWSPTGLFGLPGPSSPSSVECHHVYAIKIGI